jgi:hypothetical protein
MPKYLETFSELLSVCGAWARLFPFSIAMEKGLGDED